MQVRRRSRAVVQLAGRHLIAALRQPPSESPSGALHIRRSLGRSTCHSPTPLRSCANPQAQAGKQHLNTGFSGTRIGRLGKTAYTTPSQTKTIRRLLAGRK